MYILKLVRLQTSQRLFSRQGALIKFVNGSMMVSTETPSATANQMNATQLKLWRVGYKMGVYVSFTFLFSSYCSVFIKHFLKTKPYEEKREVKLTYTPILYPACQSFNCVTFIWFAVADGVSIDSIIEPFTKLIGASCLKNSLSNVWRCTTLRINISYSGK